MQQFQTYDDQFVSNNELLIGLKSQAHYRLVEALALEREDVENEPDSTLPPIDRQKRKLGDIPQLFHNAYGYEEEKKKPKLDAKKGWGKIQSIIKHLRCEYIQPLLRSYLCILRKLQYFLFSGKRR